MKKKFGLVLVTLLLLGLVSSVQAVTLQGESYIYWTGESGAHLTNYYTSDDASTLCTQIVLDTSPIEGIIKQPFMSILPPSGCTVSGWDTQQLTISCSPGLPAGDYVEITNVLMEDAEGTPMVDFSGATVTATFTGKDCVFTGTFIDVQEYLAEFGGTCGGANNVVCHGDVLPSEVLGFGACAPTYLNLQGTTTCDGINLKWNDVGAEQYVLMVYTPSKGFWDDGDGGTGTSKSLPNLWFNTHEAYSFAIIPYSVQTKWECYSNIVCDVELPTTCTDTPEFPSIFLPAAMIIGFLGAVLLIQRTREH